MASSSKPKRVYDVFLSFRGTDLRNNFVGHLYQALHQNGIHTFRDSEELKKGDQISPMLMKAIEESFIAIIVFSEDFASSWWCLEEVAKIMECKEQNDLIVLPLFFKVDPREVRTGRGSYAKALKKHESKYKEDSEKVNRWKKALFDAGGLSGWTFNDEDEAEFIQGILKEISTRLDRKLLHVAMHPVGIDSQVVELKPMLNLKSDDDNVVIVGLWGQGGIGKTTLAKAVYNDIVRQFENSCFLANVREASKDCKDLVTLQEKLLFETLQLKERLPVSNVDRGIKLIQERLGHKKVLIILDEVNDLCQLRCLVGDCKWISHGSRIIVTTRDSHLLTYLGRGRYHVYKVREMDDSHARELFNKHAFPTPQNLEIRTNLVDSVLNHAKGLPLALEVLGSFFCGRREDEWESAIEAISTAPEKGINDVLKISYGGLEPNVQEIFLHIACFFKGWDSEYVQRVLISCDLKAVIGLKILVERSLIRFEFGKIQMHDLIQLMGKDIVKQESDVPRKRSRLWLYDDVHNVLSSDMGKCAIKAMVLEPPQLTEIYVGPNAFTKMERLTLLILRNVCNSFPGPLCLPNGLRWFAWDGRASWILESSFGPKKLVGLHMENCSIPILPGQFTDFSQLKFISLWDCHSLVSTLDVSHTPHLEELDIRSCKNLVEVHESIAYHDKLRVWRIIGCFELSVFPKVLKSKNLEFLHLSFSPKFTRFPDIPHRLEHLTWIVLRDIAIKGLPASIENLISLRRMNIESCDNLVSLLHNIYKLRNLEELEIAWCHSFIGLPKYEAASLHMEIGLPNLESLKLDGCHLSEVEFLEDLSCFPILGVLHLGSNNITSLPSSIGKRDHLSRLMVRYCAQLQEIPEIPPSLKYLDATGCKSLQTSGHLTSIDRWVHRGSTVVALAQEDYKSYCLPGKEMPKWFQPVENNFISFKASKDLYDKFIGLVLCAVNTTNEEDPECSSNIVAHFNGERRGDIDEELDWFYSDHILLQCCTTAYLWKVVDFDQIGGSDAQFSLTQSGKDVKKWGFRIICRPLGGDLREEIQNKQLMDLAILYEVNPTFFSEVDHNSTGLEVEDSLVHEIDHNSTDSEVEDSLICEVSSIETYQREDSSLEACEPRPYGAVIRLASSIERDLPEDTSLEACEPRPGGVVIRLAEMTLAVFARCFCC